MEEEEEEEEAVEASSSGWLGRSGHTLTSSVTNSPPGSCSCGGVPQHGRLRAAAHSAGALVAGGVNVFDVRGRDSAREQSKAVLGAEKRG
jgi:hypothetical protein